MTTSHDTPTGQHRHPTTRQYVTVAIFLFAITIVEFIIIYIDALDPVVVPILIILSAIKFATVIMFYMHLKFDSKLFTWVFLGGLLLAFAVGIGLLALFDSLSADPQPREFAGANAEPYAGHGEEPENGDEPPVHPTPESDNTPQPTPPGEETPEATEPPGPGNGPGGAEVGQAVFTGPGGCNACHAIEGISTATVGPDLSDIGSVAAERKPEMNAEEYIRKSIENPTGFIVEGYPPIMPNLRGSMSDEDFEGLVAFLLEQQ